jgi:hypothetical protein
MNVKFDKVKFRRMDSWHVTGVDGTDSGLRMMTDIMTVNLLISSRLQAGPA